MSRTVRFGLIGAALFAALWVSIAVAVGFPFEGYAVGLLFFAPCWFILGGMLAERR